MGGLLDKANETAKTVEDVSEDEVSDATLDPIDETIGIDNKIKSGMQISGIVLLLVSMFLLLQTGYLYAELTDYLIAIFVMLLGWIVYNGSDYLSTGLSNMTMVITAIGFVGLFVATIVGTVFMNSGTQVTIASVELDGDDNEIDLSFFGPNGMSYTVEVLVDGTVEYTGTGEIDTDRGSHSIAIDEFWNGNAMNMNEKSEVTYEIKVTSDGGDDSFTFDNIMNREADTGFAKVTELYTYDAGGENREYTGIWVAMIIGMGEPSASFDFSDNYFTGTTPMPIVSDWDVTLTVKKGNSVEYRYPTITANEGVVEPMQHEGCEPTSPGCKYSGEFWNDWVQMPGTNYNELDKSDFYSGDGCYTFEIEIVNELGDTYIDSSSKIEFFWDSNEASGDSQPAEAC